MLEAWCEVISEQGAWDEAPSSPRERAPCIVGGRASPRLVCDASRRASRRCGAEPERAIELLGSAADGFTALEAEWEAAVTGLELAGTLVATGEDERARQLAEEVARVFDRLGSVRELGRVDELLGRPT